MADRFKKNVFVCCCLLLLLSGTILILLADPAQAGPGGIIAAASRFKGWMGWILAPLMVLLFPVIVWMVVQRARIIRKCKSLLEIAAQADPALAWPVVEQQADAIIRDCWTFWNDGDLSLLGDRITGEYRFAQEALLHDWAAQGQVNRCRLYRLRRLKPVHVHLAEGDLPVVWVRAMARVKDCLRDSRGKIVQGQKGKVWHESLWGFVYEDGLWKMGAVRPWNEINAYADLPKASPDQVSKIMRSVVPGDGLSLDEPDSAIAPSQPGEFTPEAKAEQG